MTGTAGPIEIVSLADQLTNTQDRETYSALMCYLNRLPPGDEFRQLAELLGLLSLVGQRIPEAISDFLTELRAQTHAGAQHRNELDARLASLPNEVAAGFDFSKLAKAMSESFRQQLTNTGLQDTAALLKAAVVTLRSLSTEIAKELQPTASTLAIETEKLVVASRLIKECNERHIERQTANRWLWQVAVLIAAFALGTLYGSFVEKRSIGEALRNVNLRSQQVPVSGESMLRDSRNH